MTRLRRLAIEGGWIVFGQIATVTGSLLLVRVLTEFLEPTQYGELALGITVAGLVNQVVTGGIINGISRFYSIASEKQELESYLVATRRLLGYATGAIVFLGLTLMMLLHIWGGAQWMSLVTAALIFSIVNSYNGSFSGIQSAARHRGAVAIHGGLEAWLKILIAGCMMLWLGATSATVLFGYACSSFLVTTSQLLLLRRTIATPQNKPINYQPWMMQIWSYSWPFTAWGIFTWMQQVSDRWTLQTFSSTADAGYYVVLYQVGYTPIALATGILVSFIAPILYQRSGDATDAGRNLNVHNLSWRITWLSMMLTAVSFLMAFFAHEWLFRILVAEKYRELSYLLPWMILAGGMFAAGQVLNVKMMSDMKPAEIMVPKITTAIIGVVLNVIGAKLAGITGVVGALVVFSAIYLTWMAYIGKSRTFKVCV